MKRATLICCALGALALAPASASANPSILYIPTEELTLNPLNSENCGSEINSALGCNAGVDPGTVVAPYADAAGLTTALTDALAEYDVMVTNTRPPEYVPYVMLLAGEEIADTSRNFSCAAIGVNCGSRQRNDIITTFGGTMNCVDPVVTHTAMYAFGRASGLEGVDNPEDWMHYVVAPGPMGGPDYTMPPLGFVDLCNDRVQQQGFDDNDQQVSLPLECTSADHVACDGPGGQPGQNSHLDLLEYYGPRTEDADPPVFSNILPADGTVIMIEPGEMFAELNLDVDITDADSTVAVRWTVQSDALIELAPPEGIFTACTNGSVCTVSWDEPLKPTDSDWTLPIILTVPAGTYNVTLEAADYHGNIAEPVTFTVTVEGEAALDSSGGNMTGNPTTGSPTTGSPPTTGDIESGTSTAGADDDAGGCSCRTGPRSGGPVLLLLGLMGLGVMRRRG